MNWLEHILGNDWTITPAGGSTGEAYYAQNDRKRLFLKRNSSPFLAVLSAEGIVPKLVWTKRMENGDVITAQQWLEGRELSPEEMHHPRVAKLLSKIHHSSELLNMLMRIGKSPLDPATILSDLKSQVVGELKRRMEVRQALNYLVEMLPVIQAQKQVVCHCDMNHNNWLLSSKGELYLIDWDNARVADPALDIGMILHWYISEEEWDEWLYNYGISKESQLLDRMYWYLIVQIVSRLLKYESRRQYKKAAQGLGDLKRLLKRLNL